MSMCACVHLPWPTEQMVCTHVYPRRTSAAWIALEEVGKSHQSYQSHQRGSPSQRAMCPPGLRGRQAGLWVLTGKPGKPSVPFPGGPSSPWESRWSPATAVLDSPRPAASRFWAPGNLPPRMYPLPCVTHPLTHQPGVSGGACRPRSSFGALRRRN